CGSAGRKKLEIPAFPGRRKALEGGCSGKLRFHRVSSASLLSAVRGRLAGQVERVLMHSFADAGVQGFGEPHAGVAKAVANVVYRAECLAQTCHRRFAP